MKVPSVAVLGLVGLVVFATALGVVYSAARNRTLFSEFASQRLRYNELTMRRGQLEIEKWTLAAHARVARLARKRLDMRPPKQVKIIVVHP